jgi:CheY-like chemotaxis protein
VLPFLREETPHDVSFKPDLIVLDLYLTTHDGLFLLNALKQDPQVLSIPVVVLTNSIRFDDLRDCYQHHVSGFIRKPLDYSSFEKRMHALVEYWANTVELPHHQHTT